MNKPLKLKLVDALRAISRHASKAPRLKRVMHAIKERHIPEEDYPNVANFIFLLLYSLPELMETNRDNASLKKLYLYCMKHQKKSPRKNPFP